MPSESQTATDESTAIICSFCQKPTNEVQTMVAGPGVFICDACVAFCVELIQTKSDVMPKLASWEERLSDDDLLATLPKFAAAGVQVEKRLEIWVRKARERGITWTRIGAALGITRQSAWERFSGEE
ncbi:MAG TPA: ClpX C4-type zinc finger protein [Streptosporangiaceae bacterium]|nr:ClpX C4-type zinc finger protein [Streptosporangiaceae bacterium]